jgi:hypothetical protein
MLEYDSHANIQYYHNCSLVNTLVFKKKKKKKKTRTIYMIMFYIDVIFSLLFIEN